ncbi:hypothetical protein SAMD00019534_051830 [Acytostelium subglobosum LB1]|uniref:hypothetical protein n=1 Tax=Acytostelium subglobosum LB1 TaxID=1410327 RepID=UPI000644B6B5|nr:hypothetical protein SAMD00019534_051830 [Acytostelium subglobosum LB1]GAM22008.1 hypothetical protein SAMD00019534_051830 [Acytostelium subglobosum LB1]|eukprot:XP_012755108.1 hypothetical protein SAMD00019534_051830 [Acytostelium subglobosum LB1]
MAPPNKLLLLLPPGWFDANTGLELTFAADPMLKDVVGGGFAFALLFQAIDINVYIFWF